jgi:hypothetical protein
MNFKIYAGLMALSKNIISFLVSLKIAKTKKDNKDGTVVDIAAQINQYLGIKNIFMNIFNIVQNIIE